MLKEKKKAKLDICGVIFVDAHIQNMGGYC